MRVDTRGISRSINTLSRDRIFSSVMIARGAKKGHDQPESLLCGLIVRVIRRKTVEM